MTIKRKGPPTAAKKAVQTSAPKSTGKAVAAETSTKHEGTVAVTRHYYDGKVLKGAKSKNETVDIIPFEGPVAHVSVNVGATKNTGGYESARIGVMVTLPCYVGEVEDCYKAASALAATFLTAELEALPEGEDEESEEAAETEGDEESSEEEGDEETSDDEEGDEETSDDEEGDGIDEAYIKSLDRKSLIEFINENEIKVNAKKFADDKAGLKKLQAAVWKAVEELQASSEDEDGEDTETEESDDDASDEEEASDESEDEDEESSDDDDDEDGNADKPYTEKELQGGSVKELLAIWKDWDLGAAPKAPDDKARKKLLIKGILKAQKDRS